MQRFAFCDKLKMKVQYMQLLVYDYAAPTSSGTGNTAIPIFS